MDGWSKDLGFRVAVIGAGLVVCVGGGGEFGGESCEGGIPLGWVGFDGG